MTSVSAAEVEAIVIPDRLDPLDHLADALPPALLPDLLQGGIAHEVLVGLAAGIDVVGELQVRDEHAVDEDRRAEPGPEGEHHLDPLPGDAAETLDVGVVADASGLAGHLYEGIGEIESTPLRMQAGGRLDDFSAAAPGDAAREPVERRLPPQEPPERPQHGFRSRRPRRRNADPFVEGRALRVEDHDLEAGPTDVDGEAARN